MTPSDGLDVPNATLEKPGFAEEALPWLDAVYRFALRLTGGEEHEAHDVVQDTFLRAYRAWSSYERGTNARAWLFTIARNVFLRERERRGRRPEPASDRIDTDLETFAAGDLATDIREADPEQAFFDSFVDEEVLGAVDRLPDEFREALVLSDIEGLPYAEVADVLSVPVGTIKSRLYRGRRLLQEELFDYAVEMGYINEKRTHE